VGFGGKRKGSNPRSQKSQERTSSKNNKGDTQENEKAGKRKFLKRKSCVKKWPGGSDPEREVQPKGVTKGKNQLVSVYKKKEKKKKKKLPPKKIGQGAGKPQNGGTS